LSVAKDNKSKRTPFEILLDHEVISKRVAELGEEITKEYSGKKLVLIGVLKGCLVFMTDLMREIDLPLEIDFISASSYRKGTTQEENILVSTYNELAISGKDILVIEGIVDSGNTLAAIRKELAKYSPNSVEIATLLNKPGSHRSKLDIKYKGFNIGNEFVIGYGLDNTQLYRNLPFVGKVIDGK
jgi:hypoxanthine phosphoribosyltransferase